MHIKTDLLMMFLVTLLYSICIFLPSKSLFFQTYTDGSVHRSISAVPFGVRQIRIILGNPIINLKNITGTY